MRSTLSETIELIMMLAISLIAFTATLVFAAPLSETLQGKAERDSSVYCNNLDEQYVDGKWKNFDLVLGDCLVQRFVHKAGEGVEFAEHLAALEDLTKRTIKQYETEIKQLQSSISDDKNRNNKVKLEVRLRVAKRQLESKKQELEKMLAEAKLEATVIETGVRDFMYKCSVPNKDQNANSQLVINSECNATAKENLSQARELHNRLEADKALLLAETLSFQLKMRQN